VWTVLQAAARLRWMPSAVPPAAVAQATESEAWCRPGLMRLQLPSSSSAFIRTPSGFLHLFVHRRRAFPDHVGVADYRIICGDILGSWRRGAAQPGCLATASPYLGLNPFYHLMVGGSAFGIAYMTTDPVSAPAMRGKMVYGL